MPDVRRDGWGVLGVEVLRTADFDGTRLRRDGTYAVCFGATWCPPTRRFVPTFVALAGSLPARIAIADITSLQDPLWDTFQIKITPTMVVFREGAVVQRFDGKRLWGLREADLERLRAFLSRGPPDRAARVP